MREQGSAAGQSGGLDSKRIDAEADREPSHLVGDLSFLVGKPTFRPDGQDYQTSGRDPGPSSWRYSGWISEELDRAAQVPTRCSHRERGSSTIN